MKNGKGCIDCFCYYYETISYMVNDTIWKEAKLNKKDKLCLPCLSKRIGRKIKTTDFTNAPINVALIESFKVIE